MTRRTVNQVIEDSIMEGYALLAEGSGSYDDKVKEYRAQNYDVRAWYVVRGSVEERRWVLYGRQKVRATRKQKKVTVDYSAMTVKELRKICSEKKIPKYSKLSKEELVQKLNEAC